jgi:hypothetical protein
MTIKQRSNQQQHRSGSDDGHGEKNFQDEGLEEKEIN